MEGLWSLLILFGVVASVVQKLKKVPQQQKGDGVPQGQKPEGARRPMSMPSNPFDPQSWTAFFGETRQEPVPPPAPVPKPFPARQPAAQGTSFSMEGPFSEGSRLSREGMDTCDPSLGHGRAFAWGAEAETVSASSAAGRLPLSFTPDSLMQGVIMSEILARPSQRKWGRR
ncbi:MAG: hypothetical protein VB099_18990 [Candidatus Limiplasma sp.]|nr:hypothetical protein [Candidatus Limiplasma sp.]